MRAVEQLAKEVRHLILFRCFFQLSNYGLLLSLLLMIQVLGFTDENKQIERVFPLCEGSYVAIFD